MQKSAAERFLGSMNSFKAQNPLASDNTTPSVMTGLLAAAQSAAPQGSANVDISVAHTVAKAGRDVARAAQIASFGAPNDQNTVIKAAENAAQQYVVPAFAHSVAQAVVAATQIPQSDATNIPSGTYAGQAATLCVPRAIAATLNTIKDLGTNPNYIAFQANLAGLEIVQRDAQKNGASFDSVIASVKVNLKDYRFTLEAMPPSSTPFEIAQNATALITQELLDIWPDVFRLVAANPGTWGNRLTVSVNTQGITDQVARAMTPKLPEADLFNLIVTYTTPDGQQQTENFDTVTVNLDGGWNRLDRVLQNQSELVRVPMNDQGMPQLPTSPLDPQSSGVGTGGTDSNPLSTDTYLGNGAAKTGLYALDLIDAFNILTIPPDVRNLATNSFGDTPNLVYQRAATYCHDRWAMLIIDPPAKWLSDYKAGAVHNISLDDLGSYSPSEARSSVVYFPRISAADPNLKGDQMAFPASGAIAGIWAATDAETGIWQAPAGLNAYFSDIIGPEAALNDVENGTLNPRGINCLRCFDNKGTVVWGARTMRGDDLFGDDYKYITTMREYLYIQNSVLQNTKWAEFETNDETLWSGLRYQVGDFLSGLYNQGAFSGSGPAQSFWVTCDASTTTPHDQAIGVVNIELGFAPVNSTGFLNLTIQQPTTKTS
jgi:phage tail sheath protein FI